MIEFKCRSVRGGIGSAGQSGGRNGNLPAMQDADPRTCLSARPRIDKLPNHNHRPSRSRARWSRREPATTTCRRRHRERRNRAIPDRVPVPATCHSEIRVPKQKAGWFSHCACGDSSRVPVGPVVKVIGPDAPTTATLSACTLLPWERPPTPAEIELENKEREVSRNSQSRKPSYPCPRCGEDEWNLESVSPSMVSATWRCDYCKRRKSCFAGTAKTPKTRTGEGAFPRAFSEKSGVAMVASVWNAGAKRILNLTT